MKIVTAYSKDYAEMARNLIKSAKNNVVIAQPIPELEDNKEFIKKCHYKLDIIEENLNSGDIVWVDADCIINRRLGNPLRGCDIAVTLRRPSEKDRYYRYSGLLNAGVIFLKDNARARKFVKLWRKELPNGEFQTDQEALNLVVGVNENTKYGDIIVKDGIKIKILSCDEYNFFYFPEENNARILHFKGDVRQYYK